MKTKLIGIALVLLLVLAGVLIVAHKKAELAELPLPSETALAVKTAKASHGTFPATQRFLATLSAKESAKLAPRVTGHLLEVRVREGAVVEKGDLLAVLDKRQEQDKVAELRADLSAARTALATQEAIYQRDRSLFQAKAISQEALDQSLAVRDSARARVTIGEQSLESAQTQLSYTRISAPFDGVVTERLADPGDLALPGRAILAMEAPERGYFVSVKVPQDLFPELELGGEALLRPPTETGQTLSTRISRIHPALRQGSLATVEIDMDNRPFGLPTGATLDVDLVTDIYEGWRVPVGAVLENTEAAYVFCVVADGNIHIERVSLLSSGPDWDVVSGELPADAEVVVALESALLRLHEGQKVTIAK